MFAVTAVMKSEAIHLRKYDQKWSPDMHLTRDMSMPSINYNPSCLITSDWIMRSGMLIPGVNRVIEMDLFTAFHLIHSPLS